MIQHSWLEPVVLSLFLPSEPQWASRHWTSWVPCPSESPERPPGRPWCWPDRESSSFRPHRLMMGPYRSGFLPARWASSSASPPRSDQTETNPAGRHREEVVTTVKTGTRTTSNNISHQVSRRHLLLQAVQQSLDGRHAFVQLVYLRGSNQENDLSSSRFSGFGWFTKNFTVKVFFLHKNQNFMAKTKIYIFITVQTSFFFCFCQ